MQSLFAWGTLLRMKFSHAESLVSLPPCAHFMFHKKISASKQIFFSRALDCDRMGRHRFSPVKEVTLLLLLLMLSTGEKNSAFLHHPFHQGISKLSHFRGAKEWKGVLLKIIWWVSCNPVCRTELSGALVLHCVHWGLHHKPSLESAVPFSKELSKWRLLCAETQDNL